MRESLEGTLYITEFGRARISLDLFLHPFWKALQASIRQVVPMFIIFWGGDFVWIPCLTSIPCRTDSWWYCMILPVDARPKGWQTKKNMSALTPLADCFFCNIFTLHCCGSVIDLIKDRLRTDVGCISSPALLESFTPLRCIHWADPRLTSGIAIFEADFQTGDRWHAWTSRTLNKGSGRLESHHGLLTLAYFSIIHASAHM